MKTQCESLIPQRRCLIMWYRGDALPRGRAHGRPPPTPGAVHSPRYRKPLIPLGLHGYSCNISGAVPKQPRLAAPRAGAAPTKLPIGSHVGRNRLSLGQAAAGPQAERSAEYSKTPAEVVTRLRPGFSGVAPADVCENPAESLLEGSRRLCGPLLGSRACRGRCGVVFLVGLHRSTYWPGRDPNRVCNLISLNRNAVDPALTCVVGLPGSRSFSSTLYPTSPPQHLSGAKGPAIWMPR